MHGACTAQLHALTRGGDVKKQHNVGFLPTPDVKTQTASHYQLAGHRPLVGFDTSHAWPASSGWQPQHSKLGKRSSPKQKPLHLGPPTQTSSGNNKSPTMT